MVALPPAGPPPVEFALGDVVRLRKQHPCGGDRWVVDRLGADVGISCLTCRRHVLVDRRSLERRLVEHIPGAADALAAPTASGTTGEPSPR